MQRDGDAPRDRDPDEGWPDPFKFQFGSLRLAEMVEPFQLRTNYTYDAAEPMDVPVVVKANVDPGN